MSAFDIFCEQVKKLWPRYTTTPEELHVPWHNACAAQEPVDIATAFEKCKAEYPNAPNWPFIVADLTRLCKARTQAKHENAWCRHLDAYRRNNETDEQVWRKWIEEQTRWITHVMVRDGTEGSVQLGNRGYSFKERPSGPCESFACEKQCGLTELACRAKRWPDEERERWRDYLAKHGEPIPAFLLDGYGERTPFVEPQPSNTLF